MKYLFVILLSPILLLAKPVETFYGTFEVEEPVLLELIESGPMQRLKGVHQYGVSFYTTHSEPYTRYDHSLGVFALLRKVGCSLHEQIAGLLHDVSHTVFSHVGDYVFRYDGRHDSYQDRIHEWFLKEYGLSSILEKYGYRVDEILPDSGDFPALEQSLPSLCADRIDYNLQGAFYQNFLTKKEVMEAFDDFTFNGSDWISRRPDLMKKLAAFTFHMSETCWGSADNYLRSSYLADALLFALERGVIQHQDLYFGTDDAVWQSLRSMKHSYVDDLFDRILYTERYFVLKGGPFALHVKRKFSGIDPLILWSGTPIPLSSFDPEHRSAFLASKHKMEQGWAITLTEDLR